MTGSRLRYLLSTGLGAFALAALGTARAQTMPNNPAPAMPVGRPEVLVPPNPKSATSPEQPTGPEEMGRPVSGSGTAAQPLAPIAPRAAAPPVGCSCGERQGVSRWWYHKTQCKRRLQECAFGYPEEFNEWPLGSSLYAHGRTQVANGDLARMVLYHYDFVEGSPRLNLRGRDKLTKLATLLPASFCPVVIERTPEAPGLDEQRRSLILAELAGSRFPVPSERVVIGPPPSAGLAGYEATFVYGNQINSLQAGGASGVGGYAGSPGLNAGGLSSYVGGGLGR